MKRSILVIIFIVMAFFSTNAFSQSQIEIDQQAVEKSRVESINNVEDMPFDPSILQKMRQSFLEMAHQDEEQITSASSEHVWSKNPDDFNRLKGTTWSFKYIIGTTIFEDTISFTDETITTDVMMGLGITNQYGRIGAIGYILSGGEIFTSVADVSQPFYFANLKNANGSSSSYLFNLNSASFLSGSYHLSTFNLLSYYPLTGVKTSPGPNDTDDDGDGYTENQGDCKDNNATIHPGAIEICGDGIDQDCNGSDLACIVGPTAPTGLAANAVSYRKIMLRWADQSPDKNSSFKIERKKKYCSDDTYAWTQIATVQSDEKAKNYEDVGNFEPGMKYSYRVRAYIGSENSDYSNCASILYPMPSASTPSAPVNLVATYSSASTVDLSWDQWGSTVTKFEIYRDENNSGSWTLLATAEPDARSYSDKTATNNQTTSFYTYRVQACSAAGCSPPAYKVGVPFKPTGLEATDSTGKVVLEWTDNSNDNRGFEIYRKEGGCNSTASWEMIKSAGQNSEKVSGGIVTSGVTYSYKIRAYCRSWGIPYVYGYSDWSNCVSVTENKCTDADSDGYYAQSGCGTAVDCNDGDSGINPGHSEICDDEKDNDCDGSVDEGCPTSSNTWQDIFEDNEDKTVLVSAFYSDGSQFNGSGFFVKDDVVVTNNHVVPTVNKTASLRCVEVTTLNTTVWDVIGIDYSLTNRDIAFLELPNQISEPVNLGTFNSLSVLDDIMHIGNPLSLNWTANKGSVSAIRQAGDVQGLDWIDQDTNIIQHDISSDYGSSGGIILNESGKAVSILFAGFPNDVASGEFRFGISIDYVTAKLNDLSFSPIDDLVPSLPNSSNYEKTALLFGSWYFTFTISSTAFDYQYYLNDIKESTSTPGDYYIFGTGEYGDLVIAGYDSEYNNWSLLDPGSIINRFYVFNTDGDWIFPGGCYYQINNSTGDFSKCYSLSGYKFSQTTSMIAQLSSEKLDSDEEKIPEVVEMEVVDKAILNRYLEMKKRMEIKK